MIIYLILLHLIIGETKGHNILNNDLFSAKFNNNKILITSGYYNTADKISYGYLLEENTNNKKQIEFEYIIKDNEYSMDYVKTTLSSSIVNIDIINKMFVNTTYDKNDYNKITKFTNDKLYITIVINNWKNQSKNNDLILDLDFDNNIYDIQSENNNYFEFSYANYIIHFTKTCNADSYKKNVFITKFKKSNKLLIHFPHHQNHIIYTYSISLKKKSNILYWIIIPIISFSVLFYKYKQMRQSQYNNYYNKYKYY